jgi:hypothetical protein
MSAWNVYITAGADDGHDEQTGGLFNATAVTTALGKSGAGYYDSFFRFLNAPSDLPGATIDSAKITFICVYTSATPVLRIYGNDIDDAVAPTNHTTFAALALTTAYADWSPAAKAAGNSYDTPDLATIVQEIVSRPGFASGSDLQFIIKWISGAYGHFPAAFDNTTYTEAYLQITYTPANRFIPKTIMF